MFSQLPVEDFLAKLGSLKPGGEVIVILPTDVSGFIRILGGTLITTLFEGEFYFSVTRDVGLELIEEEIVPPEGLLYVGREIRS